MDKKRWSKIQKLFRKVTELPADQRAAFVEQIREKDERLAEELDGLLASHLEAEADDFLEDSPLNPFRPKIK